MDFQYRTVILAVAAGSCAALIGCSASSSIVSDSSPPVVPSASAPAALPTRAPTPAPMPTPAPTPSVTAVAADRSDVGTRLASAVLVTIAVKGRAPLTGYSRAEFGSTWTDANDDLLGRNGCDTRNDVLRRDLSHAIIEPGTNGCVVSSGELLDPYTARPIAFTRGASTSSQVQIDHVVALGDAWQTGAQQLTPRARTDLANDPLELLAVDGPTNEAKGDGDAATWLPPNKAYRCSYVARQVAVKARYGLWMTSAERTAISQVLSACPTQTAPTEAPLTVALRAAPAPRPSTPPPAAHSSSRPPPRTTPPPPRTSPPAPAGCTRTSSGSCIRGGEFCPKADYGQTGTDAEGRRYTCTGDADHPHWE